MSLPGRIPGAVWAGFYTLSHDLRGCAAEITVLRVPDEIEAVAYVGVSPAGSAAAALPVVRVYEQDGEIHFFDTVSGSETSAMFLPEIQSWRLVFEDDTVRGEIFVDEHWSPLGDAPMPAFVETAEIDFGARSDAPLAMSDLFIVDAFASTDP